MSRGFRVWDMVSECYLPVSRGGNDGVLGITTDGTGIIYLEDGEVNVQLAGASSVIIEQDTGLKDKNGKKIYGGDVLMTCVGRAEVFYDYEYCMWKIFAKHGTTMPLVGKKSTRHLDYEVIGNIHENGIY